MNFLQIQLDAVGTQKIAAECRVSRQAVDGWFNKGRLPDTDYLPSTHHRHTRYANVIARLCKCKKEDLLSTPDTNA